MVWRRIFVIFRKNTVLLSAGVLLLLSSFVSVAPATKDPDHIQPVSQSIVRDTWQDRYRPTPVVPYAPRQILPVYEYYVDDVYEPTPTPTPLPAPAPAPVSSAASLDSGRFTGVSIGSTEIDQILEEAGWPSYTWVAIKVIGECESKFRADAVGDQGRSLGWLQLNEFHFPNAAKAGAITYEEAVFWYDPLVNAKVARWLWEARGQRFAGGGGWSCADLRGIYP